MLLSKLQLISYIKSKINRNDTKNEDIIILQKCLVTLSIQKKLDEDQIKFITDLRNKDIQKSKKINFNQLNKRRR